MNFTSLQGMVLKRVLSLVLLLVLVGGVNEGQAQWVEKWLAAGDFHHPYLSGGAEPEDLAESTIWNWPGIVPQTGNSRWKALWISTKNFTDENGDTWEVKNSHIGPRVLGIGEMFDMKHELVSRFPEPHVTVDGLETFNRPSMPDRVADTLNADRIIDNVFNTSVGVTVRRKAQQFSEDNYDDFHLVEYTFTNTGNVDDDPEEELKGQALEDVYFVFNDHATINSPSGSRNHSYGNVWGQYTMNDAVGDGLNDYGVDFRAQFSWTGESDDHDYDELGNPIWYDGGWHGDPVQGDTMGRLAGAHMVGTVTIHADPEAHAPGVTLNDEKAQPRLMSFMEHDWSKMTTGNSDDDKTKMRFERDYIENGAAHKNVGAIGYDNPSQRVYPTHAMMVEPDGDFATSNGDPSLGRAGGWAYVNGYGPYDLEPGEQVKIVVAEGAQGLSEKARWHIGRTYKLSGAKDSLDIPFDANGNGKIEDDVDADGDGQVDYDEVMNKNEWVMTSRDSLFKMFEGAIELYQAYQNGEEIPRPPLPPQRFKVESGIDEIKLSWEPMSGGPARTGWRLYRAQNHYSGLVTSRQLDEKGLAIPDSSTAYRCIAGCEGMPSLGPDATGFTDEAVNRGVSYYYYLQAVGEVNQDSTGNLPVGVPLKSSRYYTQTYEPAVLRRQPGGALSEVRAVPNPYNLAASEDIRFGDQENKIAFYGLPGQATIRIYTELGELVKTIEHTDGSGDEFWNLTTSSRQLVVSGMYFAVITDQTEGNKGAQATRKIVIIR